MMIKMMLDKIIKNKFNELKGSKKRLPLRSFKPKLEKSKLSFKQAISRKGLNLIAEIKKKSPSRGIIKKAFDPIKIAKIYEQSGAAAISVLTDKKFFGGDLAHLQQSRLVAKIPLLRKDFIIDKYQIYASRLYG